MPAGVGALNSMAPDDSPRRWLRAPENITDRPWPPASTTPAFASTSSISGVSTTVCCAFAETTDKTWVSDSDSRHASAAASAARRITVSIVPSMGFCTALYAATLARLSASANSGPARDSRFSRAAERPKKYWARIRPLLPRAPRRAAEAIVAATAPADFLLAPGVVSTTLKITDASVRHMLVPVSPSGTGNTLSALISAWLCSTALVEASTIATSPVPSTDAGNAPESAAVSVILL